MDPSANLKEQLELAEKLFTREEEYESSDDYDIDARRLAELVLALNEWIMGRGYMPVQWQAARAQRGTSQNPENAYRTIEVTQGRMTGGHNLQELPKSGAEKLGFVGTEDISNLLTTDTGLRCKFCGVRIHDSSQWDEHPCNPHKRGM